MCWCASSDGAKLALLLLPVLLMHCFQVPADGQILRTGVFTLAALQTKGGMLIALGHPGITLQHALAGQVIDRRLVIHDEQRRNCHSGWAGQTILATGAVHLGPTKIKLLGPTYQRQLLVSQ